MAILCAQPAVIVAALSAPYKAEVSATIAPGVVHERGALSTSVSGRQAVYVVRVDMSQPVVRFEASISNDRIVGLEPTTSQANRKNHEGHRAVAAINADFFDSNQAPFGIHIENGELIAYGPKPRPSFGVTADRRVLIGNAGVSGSLCRVDGICMPVARLNQARTMGEGTGELDLYTSRFGDSTGTDESGTEVTLSGAPSPLPVKGSFEFTVKRVRTKYGATKLTEGEVVLSGSGVGAKFLDLLPDGAHVALTLTPTSGWETAAHAISGPNILVREGSIAIDPYQHGYADVALARSGIGITAKGDVLLFAIDGRQPGYSMGVTLDELAELMVSQGVVTGLNLDGGGSTTLGIRLPGNDGVTMVNRGADGSERAVGNSLILFSSAPTGPLAQIAIRPDSAVVLSGSHLEFAAFGEDAANNAVRLSRGARWEVAGNIGTIDTSGRFTAGAAGDGSVKATIDDVAASTPASVVASLSAVEIVPSPVIVSSGATQMFTLIGRDAQNRNVFVDASAAEWRGSPAIGKFTQPGSLAASKGGRGSISVVVGPAMANARVEIGKAPVVIESFEDTNSVKISASRASANVSRAVRPEPVRSGSASLKLTYDFRNQTAISAASVRWDPPKEIESRPLRVGVWVWGDGSHHDLRGNYRDASGAIKIVNFTQTPGPLLSTCERRRGGIDWVGWKYLEVPIPHDVIVPIRWERIYLVEGNDRCDNASSIFFDDLRAVYLESSEDTTGPSITALVPQPGAVIEGGRPEIGGSVKDPSGIEPSSVRLLVDGVQVPATFDDASGRARYIPLKPLEPGVHHIHLEAEDRVGNPTQPFAEWEFTVK
ncbi:MAG TPA: phosphodiester glycosidase family protein [Thermoanaerobaculia bacterium]